MNILPRYGSLPSDVHPSQVRIQYLIESSKVCKTYFACSAGINFLVKVCRWTQNGTNENKINLFTHLYYYFR